MQSCAIIKTWKGGDNRVAKKKKKRRRQKPTARPQRMVDLALNILAGTISGLLVLAFQKLMNR